MKKIKNAILQGVLMVFLLFTMSGCQNQNRDIQKIDDTRYIVDQQMILILCEDSELGKAYTGIRNGPGCGGVPESEYRSGPGYGTGIKPDPIEHDERLSGTIGKVQFTVKRTFKGRKETVRKQSVYWYV